MTYVLYGQFYGDSVAPTRHDNLIEVPNNNGIYQPGLVWGYDYWPSSETPAETCPNAGSWRTTKDLRSAHGVPLDATAVRVHIKAKTFSGPTPVGNIQTACQITAKPHGLSVTTPNEFHHCVLSKASNAEDHNEYDLGHVQVDLPLNSSGKIDFWLYPSIVGGSNAQIALYFYLAGYWK